jgi:ATP-dependent DNA helicase UvrD/PcrA
LYIELGEKMGQKTYHQYVLAEGLTPECWRPEILELPQALRFDPVHDTNADTLLNRARELLCPYLGAASGSIAQKLDNMPSY